METKNPGTLEKDKKFFVKLEKRVDDEIKELDNLSGKYNPFSPNYWPQYATGPNSYKEEIKKYHKRKGFKLLKGFHGLNKDQLRGMYAGISSNSAKKRYRFARLIEELCKQFHISLNSQFIHDMELGKVEGDKLKEEYGFLKYTCLKPEKYEQQSLFKSFKMDGSSPWYDYKK